MTGHCLVSESEMCLHSIILAWCHLKPFCLTCDAHLARNIFYDSCSNDAAATAAAAADDDDKHVLE